MTETRVDDAAALLAALDGLLPEIRERAPEAERERTLPADLAARIEDTGLFRMKRVRALGGLELPPPTVVDVVERLAHADASTAWAVLIGATASAFFGWLDPDAARAMLAERPGGAATCVFAPHGSARPDGDGRVVVSGHWGWNSGIRHATWRQVGTVDLGPDGAPVLGPEGTPRMRLAFVPADAGIVVDHWDTMGLRGTGSHDLALDEVPVPEAHTFLVGAPNRHDGPYARLTFGDLVQIGVMSFPLGVARRALDEFAALAPGKTRGLLERWTVSEDGEVQADVGRCETELAAARAFVDAAVAELWASVQDGPPDPVAQGRVAMATAHALRAAERVVDTVFGHAGATAMRLEHPLQRCFRDLHAVAGHVFYSAGTDRTIGKRRLGAPGGR